MSNGLEIGDSYAHRISSWDYIREAVLPFGPGERIPDVSAFSVGQMNHGVGYCAPLWIGNPALNPSFLCVNSAGQNAKTSNKNEQPSGDAGAGSRVIRISALSTHCTANRPSNQKH